MSAGFQWLVSSLPRGGSLDERQWAHRHQLLLVLLTAHLPLLLVVGLINGRAAEHLLGELAPLGVAVAAGACIRDRRAASMVVTTGLMVAPAVLVHLTGGLIEAHFHYFVVLGFIALYQDWRSYLLAVALVVLGHGLLGIVDPASVYNHPAALARPWLWAAVHGGFVLLASVGHVVLWKVTEREQLQAKAYQEELHDGERAVIRRLRQAEQLKTELTAIVSHEFRSPLTSILGFSRTLLARIDDLDRHHALVCAESIERQARRLSRLVQDLLAASGEIRPMPGAATDMARVARAVAAELQDDAAAAGRGIALDLPERLGAAVGAEAARQVLTNLLDNALKFAAPRSTVWLRGRRDGDEVVVEVADVGLPIADADRERIFEPFVQADSSDTRTYGGIGLGLHIVRKLVDAHGGRVDVRSDGAQVTFVVALPWAPVAPAPGWTPVPELAVACTPSAAAGGRGSGG